MIIQILNLSIFLKNNVNNRNVASSHGRRHHSTRRLTQIRDLAIILISIHKITGQQEESLRRNSSHSKGSMITCGLHKTSQTNLHRIKEEGVAAQAPAPPPTPKRRAVTRARTLTTWTLPRLKKPLLNQTRANKDARGGLPLIGLR